MTKKTTTAAFKKFLRDFYSEENRIFKIKLGKTLASSLVGFICGIIIASLFWYIAMNYVVAITRIIYVNSGI